MPFLGIKKLRKSLELLFVLLYVAKMKLITADSTVLIELVCAERGYLSAILTNVSAAYMIRKMFSSKHMKRLGTSRCMTPEAFGAKVALSSFPRRGSTPWRLIIIVSTVI